MPLGLVCTQVTLLSCSTHSSKLLFFQKAAAVIVIVDLTRIKNGKERREGRMHETNSIFQQTPSPHFCLKVECKNYYFWGPVVYVILITSIIWTESSCSYTNGSSGVVAKGYANSKCLSLIPEISPVSYPVLYPSFHHCHL